MTKDLAKSLVKYSKKWVAISKDGKKILASGTDMKTVIENLGEHNPDEVTLTYVIPPNGFYAPLCRQ